MSKQALAPNNFHYTEQLLKRRCLLPEWRLDKPNLSWAALATSRCYLRAAYASINFDQEMSVQALAASNDGTGWFFFCQGKDGMPNVLVVVPAHIEIEQFNSAYMTALDAVISYLRPNDR